MTNLKICLTLGKKLTTLEWLFRRKLQCVPNIIFNITFKTSHCFVLLCLYGRVQQQSREPMNGDNSMSSNGSSNIGNGSVSNNSGGQEPTRTERIQQLRAQHQRRHVERKGQYPLDEREERYEEALRQVRLFSLIILLRGYPAVVAIFCPTHMSF